MKKRALNSIVFLREIVYNSLTPTWNGLKEASFWVGIGSPQPKEASQIVFLQITHLAFSFSGQTTCVGFGGEVSLRLSFPSKNTDLAH